MREAPAALIVLPGFRRIPFVRNGGQPAFPALSTLCVSPLYSTSPGREARRVTQGFLSPREDECVELKESVRANHRRYAQETGNSPRDDHADEHPLAFAIIIAIRVPVRCEQNALPRKWKNEASSRLFPLTLTTLLQYYDVTPSYEYIFTFFFLSVRYLTPN
jgi:hypothetical protein